MSVRRKERADEEDEELFSPAASERSPSPPRLHIIPQIPEAVDDFLRNFLRRGGLTRTLRSFEAEWYGSAHTLLAQSLTKDAFFIPDALTHWHLLQSALETVHREARTLRQEALVAAESLARMRRERDLHQLQYRRVAEAKNRLTEDLRQLKKHLRSYEPTLMQLQDKYQAALGHNMLLNLNRVKLQHTADAKVNQEKSHIKKERSTKTSRRTYISPEKGHTSRHPKDTEFPMCNRLGTLGNSEKWESPSCFTLTCSIRAHELPISCIELHPQKHILVSASDDHRWRLWALPADGEKVGQLLLTGEGHSDWLSGCSFHPDGAKLATTSGDSTVRLWDFSRGCCVSTLSGHSQPTWGCSFHSGGLSLASCSGDATAKLWDVSSQRCCVTLRRHAAAVNSVCFLSASDLLLTCSADKTLALWDARLGICTATFRGHRHPCNHAAVSVAGSAVASCDSRGTVNLWDVRNPGLPTAAADAGPQAAHQVAFSPAGREVAVACADGVLRLVEVDSCAVSSLPGRSGGAHSVTFGRGGHSVMSAGNDGVINIWS